MSDQNYDPIAQPENTPLPNVESGLNRGYDNRVSSDDAAAISVTLEDVDTTIINYLKDTIHPTVQDNNREVPVPVIYANPERWKSIRKDGFMRDSKNARLQTPYIIIRRTSTVRNELTNPSNKYVYRTFEAQWNKRNAYDRFAVQNSVTPSRELRHILVPDYVDLTYQLIVVTTYQKQMNDIIEQINVENDEFWGNRNQFKFRVRIEEYLLEDQLPATKERMIRNTFEMKVAAYLIPEKFVKDWAAKSPDSKTFTSKKLVTFVELDQTGNRDPGGLETRQDIPEYYDRIKAIPPDER